MTPLLPPETLARRLLDAVEDEAIFALDVEGKIASWGTGAQQITGYTAEQARGKHLALLFPEDEVRLGGPARELRRSRSEGCASAEGWRVR